MKAETQRAAAAAAERLRATREAMAMAGEELRSDLVARNWRGRAALVAQMDAQREAAVEQCRQATGADASPPARGGT